MYWLIIHDEIGVGEIVYAAIAPEGNRVYGYETEAEAVEALREFQEDRDATWEWDECSRY